MTAQQHTCYTLVCDGCGEDLRPGDEYIAHFDDVDSARVDAADYYDWTRDGDRDLCGQCTAVAACARDGHQPSVYDNTATEWCKRCGQHLRDVAIPPVKEEFL